MIPWGIMPDLRALFARSRVRARPLEVAADEAGVIWFPSAGQAG